MKILFVVHRTYPYNGGSEYNVKLISESLSNIGYEVSVLTDQSKGNYGNVKVTTNRNILFSNYYDWIIIHGNDMPIQDYTLNNIINIKSKVLYWVIKPSDSESAINGFKYSTLIGWGTSYDYNQVIKYNCLNKSKYIRYACDVDASLGEKSENYYKYFLSSGGFANHKGFNELINIFLDLNLSDTKLVLTGYIGNMSEVSSDKIIIKKVEKRTDYLNILRNSDLYIMNSFDEGFGLVLLDAMINKVPWISRNIAGATDMIKYGSVYSKPDELKQLILNHNRDEYKVKSAYEYVISERTVQQMTKDFETIFNL